MQEQPSAPPDPTMQSEVPRSEVEEVAKLVSMDPKQDAIEALSAAGANARDALVDDKKRRRLWRGSTEKQLAELLDDCLEAMGEASIALGAPDPKAEVMPWHGRTKLGHLVNLLGQIFYVSRIDGRVLEFHWQRACSETELAGAEAAMKKSSGVTPQDLSKAKRARRKRAQKAKTAARKRGRK